MNEVLVNVLMDNSQYATRMDLFSICLSMVTFGFFSHSQLNFGATRVTLQSSQNCVEKRHNR